MTFAGTKLVVGTAALATVLSGCGSTPGTPQSPGGGTAAGSSATTEQTETREAGHPTFENGTAVPEETREAGHPTFENGTAVPEDSGNADTCSSKMLSGSFGYKDEGTPSTTGYLSLTNNSSAPCKLDSEYFGVTFADRDGNGIFALQDEQDMPPAPADMVLAPDESASVDVQWQSDGHQCHGMVWSVNVTVLAEDAALELDPLTSGVPENFGVCGDTIHLSGFKRV